MKQKIPSPSTFAQHGAALLCLAVASSAAWAGTALEDQILRAPMPHTQLGQSGPSVKAHYVRLHTAASESNIPSTMADSFKQNVLVCVKAKQKIGVRATPPAAFPQFANGVHKDTYVAANRQITYLRQYMAVVSEADCSLKEIESHTATLSSARGSCKIDLVARTARGQCDAALHASAPVQGAAPGNAGMQEQMARMAADPRTAAAAAQLQRMMAGAGPSGVRRRVLGIECEVFNGAAGGSACRARGGSFQYGAGLVLEDRIAGISVSTAVQAALDAQVSAATFTPHAGAGFRVSQGVDE